MKKIECNFGDEVKNRSKLNEITQFHTELSFLREHNGLRNGRMHMFIGTAGGGKSTLMRSVLRDILFSSVAFSKVLVWLSEESCDELEDELVKCCNDLNSNTLYIFSEVDEPQHKINELYLREYISEIKPDIFIYDNLTTSELYEGKTPKDQLLFVKFLKRVCLTANIPFILMAHTGAEITENSNRLISMNDIRGSKNVVNSVQFMYLMQRFKHPNGFYPTVRVVKYRGYAVNNDIHKLVFSHDTMSYTKSFPIPFEEFKQAFKDRYTL